MTGLSVMLRTKIKNSKEEKRKPRERRENNRHPRFLCSFLYILSRADGNSPEFIIYTRWKKSGARTSHINKGLTSHSRANLGQCVREYFSVNF